MEMCFWECLRFMFLIYVISLTMMMIWELKYNENLYSLIP